MSTLAVRFLRRRNLGSFEHIELEVQGSAENKSKLNSEIKEIMGTVEDALYGRGEFSDGTGSTSAPVTPAPAQAATPAVGTQVRKTPASSKAAETKVPDTKAADTKVADTKVAETKAPETKVETPAPEAKVETPAAAEATETKVETPAPAPEAKAEKAAPAKKAETTQKAKATKETKYNREDPAHKNILGIFLDATYPGWRTAAHLPKAGAASRELQGQDFLDNEGNVLESFKAVFAKHMVDVK